MQLSSSSFAHEQPIPRLHTCEGADLSPPLTLSGVPDGCRSLALIVDDPDAPDPKAPRLIWVHWVLYNLPPTVRTLPQGADPSLLPPETRVGQNDFGRVGWNGPCPPIGRHRYFFRLYALDAVLPDLGACPRHRLEAAMDQHILASAELMGTYQKGG